MLYNMFYGGLYSDVKSDSILYEVLFMLNDVAYYYILFVSYLLRKSRRPAIGSSAVRSYFSCDLPGSGCAYHLGKLPCPSYHLGKLRAQVRMVIRRCERVNITY